MDAELTELLDHLARACRILEMEGHGDMSLGHLSLRDPQGRGFWLKRNRIGLGEVLGPDDFVLVDWDGKQLIGKRWPSLRMANPRGDTSRAPGRQCRRPYTSVPCLRFLGIDKVVAAFHGGCGLF